MSNLQSFTPEPISTTGAAQQISEQIRLAIRRGTLLEGHRLPSELELAEQYGVSRGTIREAMKLLAAAQLIETVRGAAGGTYVRLPRSDDVAESIGETLTLWFNAGSTSVTEVNAAREWIERGCVRLAAQQRDDADLDAIRAAVDAVERPGVGVSEMLALDLEFHAAVARAAKNDVLELAMNAIHLIRPWTNKLLHPLLRVEAIGAQHRSIFDGIAARDVAAAERAFDSHMAYLAGKFGDALTTQQKADIQISALASEANGSKGTR